MGNVLYYGDNLDVLRRHVKDESVDLIYLDPPFNSNANYNVLFGHADGTQAAAQIRAFDDTWHWDQAAAAAFQEVVTEGGSVAEALVAFQTVLGPSTMLAYLSMMAPRLVELRRVLRPSGSIYLHCDPTASHYLKLLMDAVFGAAMFRNEIAWHYSGWNKKLADHFERRHDVILFYAKSGHQHFPNFTLPWESETEYLRVRKQKVRLDDDGRKYVMSDGGGGKRVRRFLDEAMSYGKPLDDVWDIDKLNNSANESLGYPTQKPEALLERIISASSSEGAVVLDPFCGCGTTIAAAERLGRNWIGIDVTYLAISLIKSRLAQAGATSYAVLGEPTSADDAAQLAGDDPYQFQWWALGLIGARPAEGKKGADQGIDGRLFFFDGDASPKQVIVSVKAGKVQVPYVRDLVGVLAREKAQIGVLISLNEPTGPMRKEAASAGFYTSMWGDHPRVQLLTVAELLAGAKIDMPPVGPKGTTVALPEQPEAVHPDQLALGSDEPA